MTRRTTRTRATRMATLTGLLLALLALAPRSARAQAQAPAPARALVTSAAPGNEVVTIIQAGPDTNVPPVEIFRGAIGGAPLAIATTRDGLRTYVGTDAGITVIEGITQTTINYIPLTPGVQDLAVTPDGTRLLVTTSASATVRIVDPSGATPVVTIPIDGPATHIAVTPDGTKAFVTIPRGPVLPGLVRVIPIPGTAAGASIEVGVIPQAVAISADGSAAWVTSLESRTITPIDIATEQRGTPITLGPDDHPHAIAITPDSRFVFAADTGNTPSVAIVDTQNGLAVTTVTGPNPLEIPQDLAAAPNAGLVYVLYLNIATNASVVRRISTGSLSITDVDIAVPADAAAIAMSPAYLDRPVSAASEADLTALRLGTFVPFDNGALRLTGPLTTSRHLSFVRTGEIDTSGFDAIVWGNLVGPGTLVKTGAGSLTLRGAGLHGGTRIDGGEMRLEEPTNVPTHPGPIAIAAGARLSGGGGTGTITAATGAVVSPGGAMPGVLSPTSLTLPAGATLEIDINGETLFDAVRVPFTPTGRARLNNSTLLLRTGFQPPVMPRMGQLYTIVMNATGEFNGLPHGAEIRTDQARFQIQYNGEIDRFFVDLLVLNGAPTIEGPTSLAIPRNGVMGPVAFTIGDDLTPPDSLRVTVSSSNEALVPTANLQLGGSGANRTLTATPRPDAQGIVILTIEVTDFRDEASTVPDFTSVHRLMLRVGEPDVEDLPPTITGLRDQTISVNTVMGPIGFTVGDDRTPLAELIVTATSSNTALVPDANLRAEGVGALRTLTATPLPGQSGQATITVTVSDGARTASQSFVLTVTPEVTYLLSEGSTGAFFDTDILIANPHDTETPVTITFFREQGSVITETRRLAASSRTTIRVDEIAGMEQTAHSTAVVSTTGRPLIVERTMRWNDDGYGAHTDKAATGTSAEWFFAEGSQGFFYTYLLLVNPHATANVARVTWLREDAPPVEREYRLEPQSRLTVDAGGDPDLVDHSFGARVRFDLPAMAERAMYFDLDPFWSGGHESAGVVGPSTRWFFAEGATGSYFTTFLLLANPNDVEARATITYLPDDGAAVTLTYPIAAGRRRTINIALEDPSLAGGAIGARVESDHPIVAERAQYWPGPPETWLEAHDSFGMADTALRWGLAEGRVGGPQSFQTYILLANPGDVAADVTIRFLREDGAPITKTFTVAPTTRFNVDITGAGSLVPELTNEMFSAVIESTQPIAVERSMYADHGGVRWVSGTNATATRLP